jgi:hypothetical protein
MQWNKIVFTTMEEFWIPKEDMALEPLKVVRNVPLMAIVITSGAQSIDMSEQWTQQCTADKFLNLKHKGKKSGDSKESK